MYEVFFAQPNYFLAISFQLPSAVISRDFLIPNCSKVKIKITSTLRLAVYRQSVRPDVKLLETHEQTSSLFLTRRWG
jgi:hypothetical protein